MFDEFSKAGWRKDFQFFASLFQAIRRKQTDQPENVIAVQVADKDLLEPVAWHPKAMHLMLGALATVDEEIVVFHLQDLSRIISPLKRTAGAVAENGNIHEYKLPWLK